MNKQIVPSSRSQAYSDSAKLALTVTAPLLVMTKLITPLPLPVAMTFAVFLFIFVFGMRLRMTPFESPRDR